MNVTSQNRQREEFIPTRRSLLSRLRNIDDAASWRDFFDTYWKLIFNAAVKSGLSRSEAEDIVQETVITVARRMPEFRYDPARGSFKGWLLKTTKWRILDHLRKRARHAACEPASLVTGDFGTIEDIPDPVSNRLDELWEEEWRQNLMDAAAQRVKRRVKPKHYQIFELHVLKQWPVAKVAKDMRVNAAEVHLIKHRVGKLIKAEVSRLEKDGV